LKNWNRAGTFSGLARDATGMLRRGFDVRTVQHSMGHKSLETTIVIWRPRQMFMTGSIYSDSPGAATNTVSKKPPARATRRNASKRHKET